MLRAALSVTAPIRNTQGGPQKVIKQTLGTSTSGNTSQQQKEHIADTR